MPNLIVPPSAPVKFDRKNRDGTRIIAVHLVRATAEDHPAMECIFCHELTTRVVACQVEGFKMNTWNGLYICDFCMKAIREMDCAFLGL